MLVDDGEGKHGPYIEHRMNCNRGCVEGYVCDHERSADSFIGSEASFDIGRLVESQ